MRTLARVVVLLLVAMSTPALAAKWSGCPADPAPLYPSTIGATGSPFVHPGHDLRILLNAQQVAASGGFSTSTPNVVEVIFTPTFGAPLVLPPREAVGASASLLVLSFPDTVAETGSVLTGPVEVRVKRGDTLVARIAPTDLVALPAATDVTAIFSGEQPQQVVHGALGASGDLWVPARFHGKDMPMPGCPGDFMMPLTVQIGAASIPGATFRGASPLDRIRRASLYFGDVSIAGNSFYGALSPDRIRLRHIGGTRGVSICQMNDTLDLVLRVKGSRAWARSRRSPLAAVVKDGAPVSLVLRAARPMPDTAESSPASDSFGNSCETPVNDARGGGAPAERPSPP